VAGVTFLLRPWGEMNIPVAFFSILLTIFTLPCTLIGTLIWSIRRRRRPASPAAPEFPKRPR